MTERPSHGRTRANIEKAARLGIPMRVGVIAGDNFERVDEVRRELQDLGVSRMQTDRVRHFGRGAQGQEPDVSELCGNCGNGRAAIGPNGEVSPCVFAGWMGVGNVQEEPLAAILSGSKMSSANATIREGRGFRPVAACTPDTDDECKPGTPGSECTPKN
ncbi:SPASM domain-containing protein [Streptomyces prunicolor]|uniref:SPASM domain-containing protein n=1 Tax=Streptomyces prunicolor TaxID=67348 RepID=UPI003413083D